MGEKEISRQCCNSSGTSPGSHIRKSSACPAPPHALALVVFAFTSAVYSVAKVIKAKVSNASVAIVDADHSELSRQLRTAVQPPYFKPLVDVDRRDIDGALDRGTYLRDQDSIALRAPTYSRAARRACRRSSMRRRWLRRDSAPRIRSRLSPPKRPRFCASATLGYDCPLKNDKDVCCRSHGMTSDSGLHGPHHSSLLRPEIAISAGTA